MSDKVRLVVGIGGDGLPYDISTQKSGRTGLKCPFCKTTLIAAKGSILEHHFRHDGESCHESTSDELYIPGWDFFHLHFPLHVVEQAIKFHKTGVMDGCVSQTLESHRLVEYSMFTHGSELTETGKVVVGALSLPKFSDWMRRKLQYRLYSLKYDTDKGVFHPGYLEIENKRQELILGSRLYLFEFKVDGGRIIHKIGRTRRDAETRLQEALSDIKAGLGCKNVKGKVLRDIPSAGHTERFALYKYREWQLPIASLTEYFELPKKTATQLKSELTRLSKQMEAKPLDREELWLATGRWWKEAKRIEAVKEGIARNRRAGMAFGRPAGSKQKKEKTSLMEKYPGIVNALNNGESVRKAAEITGKGVNTVMRVKKEMDAQKGD